MWKGANGDGMTKSDCFRLKASGSRGGEGERSAAESSVVSWLRLDAIKVIPPEPTFYHIHLSNLSIFI